MTKKHTVLFIGLSLCVGIALGVVLCLLLKPMIYGNRSLSHVEDEYNAQGCIDQRLVGQYYYRCYNGRVTYSGGDYTDLVDFTLNNDGTGKIRGEEGATWKQYGNIVRISFLDTSDDADEDNPEYEFILYVAEDGLIYNNKLYIKQ